MQKCGQLHASIAVALIAQSGVGEVECPALMLSSATMKSNAILCIGAPPGAKVCSYLDRGARDSVWKFEMQVLIRPAVPHRQPPVRQRSSVVGRLFHAGKSLRQTRCRET